MYLFMNLSPKDEKINKVIYEIEAYDPDIAEELTYTLSVSIILTRLEIGHCVIIGFISFVKEICEYYSIRIQKSSEQ